MRKSARSTFPNDVRYISLLFTLSMSSLYIYSTELLINHFSTMGSTEIEESYFTAPPQVHSFHGILSDFDGTIIDSTDAIIKHWHK
jgi:hypothetical protein